MRQSEQAVAVNRRDIDALSAAAGTAEEALAHFKVLHRTAPQSSRVNMVNAHLNLSFILSDLERYERALVVAQRAVEMCYVMDDLQFLDRALMRVSNCYIHLGRYKEAQEADEEAKVARLAGAA